MYTYPYDYYNSKTLKRLIQLKEFHINRRKGSAKNARTIMIISKIIEDRRKQRKISFNGIQR